MDRLNGKNIVLGVCGGIAAYKSCELVRSLVKRNSSVQVVMTKNSAKFITPLTLQTLSNRKVAIDQYDLDWEDSIGHIEIADHADAIVIAPATASFIGKIASGIADNLLANIILATRAPVIFCPSMNVNMFNNPAVQQNINKLVDFGYHVLEPGEGDLACGWEGKGRLPDIEDITDRIEKVLSPGDLAGKNVLVTTGPTREFIDPVRYISNPSTGKMGYSIAKAAWMRGANVTSVSGITSVQPPKGINIIEVTTAKEMYDQVMRHAKHADIIIKCAAVSDYTPRDRKDKKIKKNHDSMEIILTKTRDILSEIAKEYPGKVLIGFAAESNNLIENSLKKIKSKNLDLIIANDITGKETGFGSDNNIVHIIDRNGSVTDLPLMSKNEIAHRILDMVTGLSK